MTIAEKIAELRRIMDRENIAAYVISGTDPHNSEYLPAPWQQRKWISGFTGSFGTVVVTREHVGFVDGFPLFYSSRTGIERNRDRTT